MVVLALPGGKEERRVSLWEERSLFSILCETLLADRLLAFFVHRLVQADPASIEQLGI
jgi:hypothetical protein